MEKLVITSKKKKEVIDITGEVERVIGKTGFQTGVVHLFLIHTTAALATADLDSGGTDLDYLDAFQEVVSPHQSKARYGASEVKYRHPHNPEHMPDHILSSLIGTSLTLPTKDGKLVLGTWQRVVLFEFDGPRKRELVISSWSTKN